MPLRRRSDLTCGWCSVSVKDSLDLPDRNRNKAMSDKKRRRDELGGENSGRKCSWFRKSRVEDIADKDEPVKYTSCYLGRISYIRRVLNMVPLALTVRFVIPIGRDAMNICHFPLFFDHESFL